MSAAAQLNARRSPPSRHPSFWKLGGSRFSSLEAPHARIAAPFARVYIPELLYDPPAVRDPTGLGPFSLPCMGTRQRESDFRAEPAFLGPSLRPVSAGLAVPRPERGSPPGSLACPSIKPTPPRRSLVRFADPRGDLPTCVSMLPASLLNAWFKGGNTLTRLYV